MTKVEKSACFSEHSSACTGTWEVNNFKTSQEYVGQWLPKTLVTLKNY